ncbi:hypothetical protein HK100_002536 [Physocladia obscura]|uniref:Uncharacterized protein n=1 Tax=Physocladia obscura TaxID=109957 RepID=A0AAD5XA63_9FUNG|nr:hypothetical protein HK100_002536 [Physocladia obscura]
MPFPMRLAAIDTTTRREKARIEAAKESGDFHSSLKTMILSGGDKEKAKKIVAKNRKSGGGGKKRSGIDEGNGKFRGGTLHISKKAADVVSKMGAGQKGRGRSIGMGIKITGVSSGGGSVGKKKGGKKFKKKR